MLTVCLYEAEFVPDEKIAYMQQIGSARIYASKVAKKLLQLKAIYTKVYRHY